jgi:hypothetical protein
MRRVATFWPFLLVTFLFLSEGSAGPASALASSSSRKFDEFGKLSHCDMTARLDNFAIQILNERTAQAYVVAYAPPALGEVFLAHIKDYLVNGRGLPRKRITTIYGGRNSDLTQPKIQLWVLPKDLTLPEPEKFETNIETFKGLFVEERAYDDFGLYYEDQVGPGIGSTTDASFADILEQQKDAVGYIVVYSGEDATPGAWQRIAQEQIDTLKKFKIGSDRLKMIFGGHQKETRTQLWVLPKDAPPPVPDAGPESPPKKAVKVGDFFAAQLDDERNQTAFVRHLSEILRREKSVRAFLVVRLEQPIPEPPSEANETAAAQAPDPPSVTNEEPTEPVDDTELVDLTKLVEKWRLELANTHKMGPDRLIVVFTIAREAEASHLSLWIVPKGAPLPDPNKEEDEPETEEDPEAVKRP